MGEWITEIAVQTISGVLVYIICKWIERHL